MAGDVVRGSNFVIVPSIDRQSATKAEADIQSLVQKAAAAVESGNDKVLANLNAKMAKTLGQKDPEVTVKVKYETNSATGQIKEIRTLSASALDPMIADYKKMVAIQGESAVKVKQELSVQRDKLNQLKQQSLVLGKNGKAIKTNLGLQRATTSEVRRLEGVLTRVSTLSSLKGQLREESQRLSMMSQYNVSLNKQGQLVATVNQAWEQQRNKVQGLTAQVNAAGGAAKGFGAKVSAAGQKMQAAFGWITAVVAGFMALAGAIGAITGRVKDIQALKLTFDGLGQSVEAQNAILGSARNIALSYGVSLRKVEGAFRRLGPAILESGGTLKDTEGAIKSISARTTMLGLNTEQAGRYIEAFAQVMGKGKLQSEELNQQFSELDGGLRGQLKNWLAANKGITDFESAMKKGEITSGVFLEAFEAINEEIRVKFLRSIGDTQKAIEEMGKEGGMTLNQLNAKLQTLTSIGLESVGQALAPLGKELMKIYAAFVQVFTKIATEMPGVQGMFKAFGHIIGVVLKVAVNTVLYAFGKLMERIDNIAKAVMDLYAKMKQVPGLGKLLNGLEEMGKKLNANFDSGIDGWSKLSDQTIGATSDLEKYSNALDDLKRQRDAQQISEEQYSQKKAQLDADELQRQKANAQERINTEKAALEEMIEARTKQLDRDQQLMERKIDTINDIKDAELEAIDEAIDGLEKQKDAADDMYDAQIEGVKAASEEIKRSIEDQLAALNQQKTDVKRFYQARIEIVKSHYSQLKTEMDAAHTKEMRQIDEKISRLRESQSAQMGALDNGPEKRRLEMMKIKDLEKQIAAERDEYRKQELKAEVESIENRQRKARLEKQFAQQMKKAQEEKAELEREQAAEKKKLDEEEKERVKQLQQAQQTSLNAIKDAVQALAREKAENARKEKEEVEAIKVAKGQAQDEYTAQIDQEEQKREQLTKAAEAQIDRLKKAHDKERKAVEDIEWEMGKMIGTQGDIADAVDNVTNGALQRQLTKVQAIRREMAKIKAPSSTDGARFAGGPVSGGSTYTVNELGKEGFLSASGKMSEIKAPSFGSWKAPSSGSVIPAHIWKGIKAGQATDIQMPRNISPGNAVARAVSTISNTGGDHIQNAVTIQSANPDRTANSVLVELAKLKRLRYN